MDTWWVDKPNLLGSRNPTDADLRQLRSDGFGVLVSLLCEEEQAPRYNVTGARDLGLVRHSIPVKDYHAPTLNQLEQFVKLVGELPPGTKVIVHCEGGTGRTGTFAAAYWVAKGMTASEAIALIRKARPRAVDTDEQAVALKDFADRRHLSLLVDHVALVYHEARNVRHLLHEQAVEPEHWKYLVALPVNRNKAWEALQGVRSEGRKAETAQAALAPFERRFKVTLGQLEVLYANPAWRNAAYGGNAWKAITELVRGLATALEEGRSAERTDYLRASLERGTTRAPWQQSCGVLTTRFGRWPMPGTSNFIVGPERVPRSLTCS